MSNYELDAKCFGRTGASRKRYFERIEATASAPDRMATANGKEVLDVVDGWSSPIDGRPGAFKPATCDFRSHFWEFLSNQRFPTGVYSNFIDDFAEDRGWIRFSDADGFLYESVLGFTDAVGRHGASTAYSAMLHKLINDRSIDALAVLVALYREAVSNGYLEEAISIKKATVFALKHIHPHGSPDRPKNLISWLVQDRVFANIWITEEDWRRYTDTPRRGSISSGERAHEFLKLVDWYIDKAYRLRSTHCGAYPIVPSSPRHIWLIENGIKLIGVLGKLGGEGVRLDLTGKFRDVLSGELISRGREQLERLRSELTPPPAGNDRFYEDPPAVVCEELPKPY